MADRYTRLLSLDKPKWNINSPVLFEKGALLRDHVANMNILQFQFRNIGLSIIKSISITIECYETIRQAILEKLEFTYLDLDVKSNEIFGRNVPVFLKKDETREFKICINKIQFADGTIKEIESDLHDIESSKSIKELGELGSQFEIEVKSLNPTVNCTTLPQNIADYWYCACGAFNTSDKKECRICGCHFDRLIELTDFDYLKRQKQLAREREEERKKQTFKKTRKYAAIVGIALAAVIAIFFLIMPNTLSSEEREIYNSAEIAYEKKEYLLAYSLYSQLPDYKKAQERIKLIDMPLNGAWKGNQIDSWHVQYYFDSADLYFAYTWDSVDLVSKESFINSKFYYGVKYKLESMIVNPNGTISFEYRDDIQGELKFTIKVISNNCVHWFYDIERYDINNPKTYDTYYKIN